ncbi:MAG: hypothetical protein F6K41_11685 [Symploca sp. SIO3E6]|nr:hypothetical protein [Caldora sp. SIO3E6]
MTNSTQNQTPAWLLPKLKLDCGVKNKSSQVGEWDQQGSEAFQDVASGLDYKSPGQSRSVSSVPTMWARPLSMEMALHNNDYPIREQIIEQWQGMLAAIALAEVRGFPLTAQLLKLAELTYEPFAQVLDKLLPDPVNALYTLNGKNPWQDIYLFLWDGKPVGMTTPSTLVCPSEEGEWVGLPWWQDQQLSSPHQFLNPSEKEQLWCWLDNLKKKLYQQNVNGKAINVIAGLINDFQASLGATKKETLSQSNNPQFFGVEINRGVLTALNLPIETQPKSSDVRLIPSEAKGEVPELLIIDPEIARYWNKPPQDIWVYQDKTLASLKIEDLRTGKITWEHVEWIESKDLFLPEFAFIDQKEALPGAFLPQETQPLTFNGNPITPLAPLNPKLLEYFTPEDLISKVRLQPINGSDGPQVRVYLDLLLSGVNNGNPPENYTLYRDYPLQAKNALTKVPVLEVWPHFRTEGWQEYYAFYYDAEYGKKTFQVSLPEAKDPKAFQDGKGSYQMVHLESFPSFIECQDRRSNLIGLILLATPEEIKPFSDWTIGVDFGTSFTNIYISRGNVVEPLELTNLHLQVTEVQYDTRLPVLFEYFIPENFTPPDKSLPLSTVLTIRGSEHTSNNRVRHSIFDGRIYVPDRNRFQPQQDWIKTALKWSTNNPKFNKIFLQHLALHITALAAKKQVKQIQWSLSFPSAFSKKDKKTYAKAWLEVTQDLQKKTGVDHICPTVDDVDYLRPESLAIAQYFADHERENLTRTTCIDLGGGTSDISIWENNQLVHQCSVQLAGKHLFSQFLEWNLQFLEHWFEIKISDWNGLKSGAFNAKLDVLLRLDSEKWLSQSRNFVADEPDFQKLIQLTAIGIAGLYYYIGMLLRVLHEEDSNYRPPQTTNVYLGGNGSRFLNWLAEGGKFDRNSEINDLLSRILSRGSGFEEQKKITKLSSKPKHEIACGLVSGLGENQTKLTISPKKLQDDPLIAGENYQLNGVEMPWNSRLKFPDEVQDFQVNLELEQLKKFLSEFHVALQDLDIEEIKPLEDYQVTSSSGQNDRLWEETKDELTSLLLRIGIKGNITNIRVEPPFILGLKALLHVLGKRWAENGKSKNY